MLPRPAGCDGDDCDHDGGVWRCLPGCASLDDQPDDDPGWPAEYHDGWTRRPPISNRSAALTSG